MNVNSSIHFIFQAGQRRQAVTGGAATATGPPRPAVATGPPRLAATTGPPRPAAATGPPRPVATGTPRALVTLRASVILI